MNQSPQLSSRLLYILHRGFVEARLLASELPASKENLRQIFDLADAFEPLPSYLKNWQHSHVETIREILSDYQRKYHGASFDYLDDLRSAIDMASELLERATTDLDASSCTFYVRDPWWPTEYRLLNMPGVA